jgi:RNA polymerase sigma factor (sigma-70 family)
MDISPSNNVDFAKGARLSHLHPGPLSAPLKRSYKINKIKSHQVCKNNHTMTNKEFGDNLKLLTDKVLLPYAMSLTSNHHHDANDLCQTTLMKLIENKDQYLEADYPKAFAKRILKNALIDNYRKETISLTSSNEDPEIMGIPRSGYSFDKQGYPVNEKNERVLKNVLLATETAKSKPASIEQNNMQIEQPGDQEEQAEYAELLNCLEKHDDTDKTILTMRAVGNSYEEIQEVLEGISLVHLRKKATRARFTLANCMGTNYE